MNYQIRILLLSFFISTIVSLIVIPILKRLKVGQIERDDGPQSHLKKQGTPTMGGIIMIISIAILTIVMYIAHFKQEPEVINKLIPLVLVSLGFGVVGLVDDFKKLVLKNTDGLKPMYKMIGLLIISVAFAIYLLGLGTETLIPIFKTYITIPALIFVPFVIFVMLGTTNAINLTDGIDGLATSVSAIILTTLTIIAIVLDVKEVVVFGSVLVGACLGFLIFNLHKAKVFMGDLGSLMLGGAIAGIALYLKMPILLIILALIPVIETISVMIQVITFKLTGKRIFKMAPIHHHFELSGWRENKIVSVFCMITLVMCIIGLYAI